MIDEECSPSFLVSIVATIGGDLAHVSPGKHVLSSPRGRGTHVLYVLPAQPVSLTCKKTGPDPSVVLSMSFYHQL